jgi:uncharacterized protein with WD repeat
MERRRSIFSIKIKEILFASQPTRDLSILFNGVVIGSLTINILSEYFAIVSGFMPSGAVLFSKDGKPKFEFGKDHKNTLHWSPLKRFLLICGFGNLDGAIEIWDTI